MARKRTNRALDERHERVSSLVWGLLLIGLGLMLTAEQLGIGPMGTERPRLTEHAAERAVDGDPETRWASGFDDDEWISIDLGEAREIARIRLVWEQAHARSYTLEASDDGSRWETLVREEDGEGGTEEHRLDARARWVRVHGLERATGYGFSLWEVEVFGPPTEENEEGALLSRNQPTQASSREEIVWPFPSLFTFFASWWPLFVIAAGLPNLLVPRSDGDEVGGMITIAVGVVVLLDNLDWSLRQAAPIVLVLVGVVVVVQSLRQKSKGEDAPEDDSRA
jgi:hypothetical protein